MIHNDVHCQSFLTFAACRWPLAQAFKKASYAGKQSCIFTIFVHGPDMPFEQTLVPQAWLCCLTPSVGRIGQSGGRDGGNFQLLDAAHIVSNSGCWCGHFAKLTQSMLFNCKVFDIFCVDVVAQHLHWQSFMHIRCMHTLRLTRNCVSMSLAVCIFVAQDAHRLMRSIFQSVKSLQETNGIKYVAMHDKMPAWLPLNLDVCQLAQREPQWIRGSKSGWCIKISGESIHLRPVVLEMHRHNHCVHEQQFLQCFHVCRCSRQRNDAWCCPL